LGSTERPKTRNLATRRFATAQWSVVVASSFCLGELAFGQEVARADEQVTQLQVHGPGKLWSDDLRVEFVSDQTPRTDADVPARDFMAGGNEKMRYFLIGPREQDVLPKNGFKLVVVLPGGDGGEDFLPFVRRIHKHAMNDQYLVAQPVAFKWRPVQKTVWPTRLNRVTGQEFATEDFVEAVVGDVAGRYPLDDGHVFTLSWSSSGPAAYAISLAEENLITGSYVAMSVFKPDFLPHLKNARGHAYVIDHSPDDRTCPFRMAKAAEQSLQAHGASVRFNTYKGGHGWRGDVYGRISGGLKWLEKQTASAK
jgi:predicted esterase